MIQELFRPDDFREDWYGYLTNQISHITLGAASSLVLAVLFFFIHGEYPVRWTVVWMVFTAYVFKEACIDQWAGVDTIEDVVFVCFYGSGASVLSFSELAVGEMNLIFYPPSLSLAALLIIAHLGLGCLWRHRNAKAG